MLRNVDPTAIDVITRRRVKRTGIRFEGHFSKFNLSRDLDGGL